MSLGRFRFTRCLIPVLFVYSAAAQMLPHHAAKDSAAGQPIVTLDTPAPGATYLSGHAYNVDPSTTAVVIYALTDRFYVQPTTDLPFTKINSDSSWANFTHAWSSLVILLVNPANYTPPGNDITNPALDPGVLAFTMYPSGPISVDFSGYTWGIKITGTAPGDQFDPGPNFWSNDPSVVYVASDGLHLKANQVNGLWQSGEVYVSRSLGYGTYRVQVASRVDQLDTNSVAAPLFLYSGPEPGSRQRVQRLGRFNSDTVQCAICGTAFFRSG